MTEHQSIAKLAICAAAMDVIDVCPCLTNMRAMYDMMDDETAREYWHQLDRSEFQAAAVLIEFIHANRKRLRALHTVGAGRAMEQEQLERYGIDPTC